MFGSTVERSILFETSARQTRSSDLGLSTITSHPKAHWTEIGGTVIRSTIVVACNNALDTTRKHMAMVSLGQVLSVWSFLDYLTLAND